MGWTPERSRRKSLRQVVGHMVHYGRVAPCLLCQVCPKRDPPWQLPRRLLRGGRGFSCYHGHRQRAGRRLQRRNLQQRHGVGQSLFECLCGTWPPERDHRDRANDGAGTHRDNQRVIEFAGVIGLQDDRGCWSRHCGNHCYGWSLLLLLPIQNDRQNGISIWNGCRVKIPRQPHRGKLLWNFPSWVWQVY